MSTICHHTDYEIIIDPQHEDDSNVRRLMLRARCQHCKEPLRFIGIDEGSSLLRPCASPDGFTAWIPGVMGVEDVESYERLAS